MNHADEQKYFENKNYSRALRKLYAVTKQKVNEKMEFMFYKLQHISLSKSPEVMALKGAQASKRLRKLYNMKMRVYWSTFLNNFAIIELQKKEKTIASNKIKDRVYETKVKSLRVLARQWKQKKSQTEYKSKYFGPKSSQTPKQAKEKIAGQFYIALRNILRAKFLYVFNTIKTTQFIRLRNSKGLYLANYLLSKRRYWLTYGYEKLKLITLKNREEKHQGEIESLETRLLPVQDSEIQNLKEKQDKLQEALDTVLKEKENVVVEVDKEVGEIEKTIQGKLNEIKLLEEQKETFIKNIQQAHIQTANYQFSRDEIFFYIYTNFLTNLKLWSEQQSIDPNNIFLNKSLVLEWLQCPVIDFNLDKVSLASEEQLNEVKQTLQSLVQEYKRLKADDMTVDMDEVFQVFFSGYSANQCSSFEELFTKIKFTSKMLVQAIKQNQHVMGKMLHSIENSYDKLHQGEEFQILQS